MTKHKKLAEYDMIVTAIDEQERIKDDRKETAWKVTAKQEATTDVRLSIKSNKKPMGYFVGLRFQMKLAIDQTTIQEFAVDGSDTED